MLELKDITKDYPVGDDVVHALRGVTLSFRENEFVSVLGPSGCGKTTLLNIIGGLDQYTSGDLIINQRSTKQFNQHDWDAYRNHSIGFVFQSVALIPMMTALETVECALRLTKYKGNRRERAMECLRLVGLSQRAQHMPQELSGGEQQRVAVARGIVHSPKVLFADEPTGELDTNTGLQVVKIFKELTQREGVTIVMTTHDTGLMEIGDAVYELEDGEIVHASER